MFLLLMILNTNSYASDKYDEAIKVSVKAAYIQSGLEADVLNIKRVAESEARKWISDKGLNPILTVGSTVVPVLLYKCIEFHTNGFSFTGTSDKKELMYNVGF